MLKLQYFDQLMWRTDSLEKILKLGKIEGRRRVDNRGWDGWMASLTQWTWVWASFESWWWTWTPGMLQSKGSQRVRHDWVTELNWKSLRISYHCNMRSRSKILSKWGPSEKCLLTCTRLCIVPFSLKNLDFMSSTHIPNTRVVQTWNNYSGNPLEVGE